MGKDVRVMVWWFVGLRLCGDVIVKWRYRGNFIFRGRLIYAKDYSVGRRRAGRRGEGCEVRR